MPESESTLLEDLPPTEETRVSELQEELLQEKVRLDKNGVVLPPKGTPVLSAATRAKPCAEGNKCLYSVSWDYSSQAKKFEEGVDAPHIDERTPLSAKYSVMASPHATLKDNKGVVWHMKGVSLVMTTEDGKSEPQAKVDAAARSFKNCAVHVLQSHQKGKVHAILQQQSAKCSPWMRSMMVNAAKLMVPVMEHSSGQDKFTLLADTFDYSMKHNCKKLQISECFLDFYVTVFHSIWPILCAIPPLISFNICKQMSHSKTPHI